MQKAAVQEGFCAGGQSAGAGAWGCNAPGATWECGVYKVGAWGCRGARNAPGAPERSAYKDGAGGKASDGKSGLVIAGAWQCNRHGQCLWMRARRAQK
jgi:hypothetical protein